MRRHSNWGGTTEKEKTAFADLKAAGRLHVLEQDIPTYRHVGQGTAAVLDRAYSNLHVGWQQLWEPFCDVLPSPVPQRRQTMYHLPITFGWAKHVAQPQGKAQAPKIPRWVTEPPA